MKKILFIFTVVFLLANCKSYKKINRVRETMKGEILYGQVNKAGLQTAPFASWFNEGYENYTADETAIDELREYSNQVSEVVIIMASWCPDTRRELPYMLNILDKINFPQTGTIIYAVDRKKKNDVEALKKYNFTHVPTFIFYDGDTEIGRIVESPTITLEEDMVNILRDYFR